MIPGDFLVFLIDQALFSHRWYVYIEQMSAESGNQNLKKIFKQNQSKIQAIGKESPELCWKC